MKRAISGQKRVQKVSIGSGNPKREPYLQGRMDLDDPVSIRISLSEVNDGRLADRVVIRRSEREFLSKETSNERCDEQRRD
jgi:hypothetical protein